MSNCAILVNSCDAYEDVWEPFFSLFHIMWKDCPYKIYLNTETKKYSGKVSGDKTGSKEVISLNSNCGKKKWSGRLKQALGQIEEEYVIFLLEDFFLMSPVRGDIIEKCIEYLDGDEDTVCIRLENCQYHESTGSILGGNFIQFKQIGGLQ